MAHEYGAATAKALLEFPFDGYKIPLYEIRSNGIHLSEEFTATVLNHPGIDWKPAYDMDWSGAPDPITAPLLPIPFTATALAAFMLDGLGAEIPRFLEAPLGSGVQAALKKHFGTPRMRVVREALQEAYACFAAAEQRVGKLVPKERRRADALSARYDEAEKQAKARERVREVSISLAEDYSRGDRARESIAELKDQVDEVYRDAEAEWQAWRIAMVRELFHAPTPASETRTNRRLSDQQRLEIVRLFTAGHSVKIAALARQFGVSRRTIDEVLFQAGKKSITPRKNSASKPKVNPQGRIHRL